MRLALFHIPVAWVAVLAFFISAFEGGRFLQKGEMLADAKSAAAAQLGFFFVILATVSGATSGGGFGGSFGSGTLANLGGVNLLGLDVLKIDSVASVSQAIETFADGCSVEGIPTGYTVTTAAEGGTSGGFIGYITDEIREAIGEERDPLRACEKNVLHAVERLKAEFAAHPEAGGAEIAGAVYDILTGELRFLE